VLFLLLNFRIAAVIVTEIWYFDVLLPLLESGQLLLLREKWQGVSRLSILAADF
jgi:hypothetical protein